MLAALCIVSYTRQECDLFGNIMWSSLVIDVYALDCNDGRRCSELSQMLPNVCKVFAWQVVRVDGRGKTAGQILQCTMVVGCLDEVFWQISHELAVRDLGMFSIHPHLLLSLLWHLLQLEACLRVKKNPTLWPTIRPSSLPFPCWLLLLLLLLPAFASSTNPFLPLRTGHFLRFPARARHGTEASMECCCLSEFKRRQRRRRS